uniref:FMRFamide-like neuropeptide FLP1 n=2 Tax=Pleocyemata TaxID=6692 RepID=FAR1_MACRS|nr:RecName: Full=Cardio-excitatory FMRFamide homolog DF2 [Procambarus clarkii]P83274.1 RecName: Full=FMRFamide-like neuropeptide FLP1; AltName: Full=DRNFLRF-amide [Macrobrachium rosenbergii]AAB26416.1 NF1=cardioexcitatory FMRFamide homolog [Procambarus clarkii=crayfish, pericardial organs, Peptide, 7 aa] [Procambarus clarkii]
DRNFLRF